MSTDQRNGRETFVLRSNRTRSSAAQRRRPEGGNAEASFKKYVGLARAAALTGDAIETENYYQHAEHYYRLMKEQAG